MPFLRRLIEMIFHGKQFKTFEMFIIKNEWQVKHLFKQQEHNTLYVIKRNLVSLQCVPYQLFFRNVKQFSYNLQWRS